MTIQIKQKKNDWFAKIDKHIGYLRIDIKSGASKIDLIEFMKDNTIKAKLIFN